MVEPPSEFARKRSASREHGDESGSGNNDGLQAHVAQMVTYKIQYVFILYCMYL